MSVAVAVVYAWMAFTAGVLLITVCCGTFDKVWSYMNEYEQMKSKGYKLMKNDKGEVRR